MQSRYSETGTSHRFVTKKIEAFAVSLDVCWSHVAHSGDHFGSLLHITRTINYYYYESVTVDHSLLGDVLPLMC